MKYRITIVIIIVDHLSRVLPGSIRNNFIKKKKKITELLYSFVRKVERGHTMHVLLCSKIEKKTTL